VTEGYWGEAESPLREGWLDTGDEGFLLDAQLYVCGRSKDTLIRGGVNYDAHEIEDAVLQALDTHAPELRCRAVAVFAVGDEAQQRERVVAMLELRRPPPDPDTLFDRIRAAVLERTGLGLDDLAHCPSLPRTTSGKLQRNLARERYLEPTAC
jgi:acyl-CoA synthetase (AMP-forming)/AMP-acid ligase II